MIEFEKVKVRVDGVVREVEVRATTCDMPEIGDREPPAFLHYRPDWSVLLPDYDVVEVVGAGDGVRWEAHRVRL